MRRLILTGRKFGRLLGESEEGLWVNCVCECGKKLQVRRGNLLAGYTQSCGCLRNERTSSANTTHGLSHTRIYKIWKGMLKRCYNPNCDAYPWYGGKGIKVHETWLDFEIFYKDMITGYDDSLSIDRLDASKNYEPGNCEWVTSSENARRSMAARRKYGS